MKVSPDVQFKFSDVNVLVNTKQILDDVQGNVHSGEILAVMGPSGSGKTTLLNAISGRCAVQSGEITLNGAKLTKQMRKKMCYVMQEDIFLKNLTLRETLYFAAMVRLSDEMPQADKISRMQDIMDALDLFGCKDTIMGDASTRGLSGGEKKRASIACELLMEPDIMLLDEPTTGLDSSTAFQLISLLKHYTVSYNKTVLITIHQPSSQIYHLFTNLMLLANGKVAYFGEASQALTSFNRAGFHCAEHFNPADFMLEMLKQDYVLQRLIETNEAAAGEVTEECPGQKKASTKYIFEEEMVDMEPKHRWATSFWTQYRMLMWRMYKQSKGRILSLDTIISTIIMAVVVGIVYFQMPRTIDTVRDRMGMIFFGVGQMGFMTIFDSVVSFAEERPVVSKERQAGMYRLLALYLAKLTSELPLSFVLPLCFFTISYWMGGLRPAADVFFISLSILLLHVLNCKGIGFMIGPSFTNLQLSITVSSTSMVSLLLLGGFYNTMFPAWLFWTRYLSVFGHTLSALTIMEFGDMMPIPCANVSLESFPKCGNNGTDFVTTDIILEQNGTLLPIYMYVMALTVTLLIYFIAGYFLFRFRGKPKVYGSGINKCC